jgi:uncharacterized protein (DUF4213/DUF364 family)
MIEPQCPKASDTSSDRPLNGAEGKLVNELLNTLIRPDAVVEQVVAGDKFIAVTAGGRLGLASLLGAEPREDESSLTRDLIGQTAAQAAQYLTHSSPFAICLGLAAVNASNTPDASPVVKSDASAESLIAKLAKDGIVGLVGHFPFTEALRQKVGKLHLFELKDVPKMVPKDQWETVLPQVDVMAVTATALLTRHMAYFLTRASHAKIVILGPTTPFSQALFQFGADYLCGSVVTDQQRVLKGIRAGIGFKAIKKNGGILFRQWTREDVS